MVRNVLGVLLGGILWMMGFFVLALLLAKFWPEYAIHGREWTQQNVFTFTPLMACCNLLFWVLAEAGGGWATAKIARHRGAVWALAALIAVYLISLHFILFWTRFPWWYNLGVVLPAIPAILFGSKLAIRSGLPQPLQADAQRP